MISLYSSSYCVLIYFLSTIWFFSTFFLIFASYTFFFYIVQIYFFDVFYIRTDFFFYLLIPSNFNSPIFLCFLLTLFYLFLSQLLRTHVSSPLCPSCFICSTFLFLFSFSVLFLEFGGSFSAFVWLFLLAPVFVILQSPDFLLLYPYTHLSFLYFSLFIHLSMYLSFYLSVS